MFKTILGIFKRSCNVLLQRESRL